VPHDALDGMSPLTAGLWTTHPAIACVAGCLGAPVIAQRLRSTLVVSGALFLTVLGLAVLSAAPAAFGLALIVLGMMVLGLSVSTVVTLGLELTAAPQEKAGAESAISETGADLGGSFDAAILGSIGIAIYRGLRPLLLFSLRARRSDGFDPILRKPAIESQVGRHGSSPDDVATLRPTSEPLRRPI